MRIIEIGLALFYINNFNSLMEVLSCLNIRPIARLKITWKQISPKHIQVLEELNELMKPLSNWANYRIALAECTPPFIPFQGVYLTDLTFIEENPTKQSPDIINFEKINMLGKIFVNIRRSQKEPYNFEPVPAIEEYISNMLPLNEDDIWDLSRKLEPQTHESTDKLNINQVITHNHTNNNTTSDIITLTVIS